MLFETDFSAKSKLSPSKETVIKVNDEIEFSLQPSAGEEDDSFIFRLHNEKGNFVVKSIEHNYTEVPYDSESKTFKAAVSQLGDEFRFSVSARVEYSKNDAIVVPVQVYVTIQQMNDLKVYEYSEIPIKLPGHQYLKFFCYVKKVEDSTVQIHIKNPYDGVKIEGKSGDYKFYVYLRHNNDFVKEISFIFSPLQMRKSLALPEKAANPELYQTFSNPKYADILLVTSDDKKIPSFRCTLAKHSSVFEAIFEESHELPVKIKLEFDAEIVKIVLDYCCGKSYGISEHGRKVFAFAEKFEMKLLKAAAAAYMVKHVNLENVCDYLAIADANHLESLKIACTRLLVEKKAEITPELQKQLPVGILFDIFGVMEDE